MKWRKKLKPYKKMLLTVSAAMIVFVTTYALIIPAITMSLDRAEEEPGIEIIETGPGTDTEMLDAGLETYSEYGSTTSGDDLSDGGASLDSGVNAEASEQKSQKEPSMPKMTLNFEIKDVLRVQVEAEEGTFPEGTTMKVIPVEEEKVLDAVQSEVPEKKSAEKIAAYDIRFLSPAGETVKPRKSIRVHLSSPEMDQTKDTLITSVQEETLQTKVMPPIAEETRAEEIVFESAECSVYYGLIYLKDPSVTVLPEENESDAVIVNPEEHPEASENVKTEDAEAEDTETADAEKEDAEAEDTETTEEEEVVEEPLNTSEEISMPEMILTSEIDGVKILVEAEEGSLPEGTILKVTPIREATVLEAIESAVDPEKRIEKIAAYDITFLSPEGEELEPLKSVRVSMSSSEVAEAEDTVIVHVEDDTLQTKVMEQVEEETGEDEVVFESDEFSVYGLVFVQNLTASVLTSTGESYTINVSLDENSGIPADAELMVTELMPGTEEYAAHLRESKEVLELDEQEPVKFARFFNIEIQKDGQKLEPKTPAKVEVIYNDPMNLEEGESLNIVHFADRGVEVIEDPMLDETGTQITYEQDSFSVTGTIINGTLNNGQQGMLIVRDRGADYIVLSDGTLVAVDEIDGYHFETENPMVWKYMYDTYYHETRAYDFNYQQLASDFYYSYINAKEEDGIGDDDYSNINPEQPLRNPPNPDNQGKTIGDWRQRSMWGASATTLENHHMRNRDPENGQYYYIGIERDPDGKPVRITGRNSLENAAEIYLATITNIPEKNDQRTEWWPEHNRVNHIDISIKGTTSIVYPLTRGYTYYYEDGSTYTPVDKTTVTLSQEVGIKTEDMRRATISAFTKDENGTRHPIDDVFYITGYSANAETQYSTDQVRIEGSFKVTTTDSTDWSERIKPENRIYYSVDASKPVTFPVVDPQGRQLYDENHQPITVTVTVHLSASFDYWDERNECPPVRDSLDSWRQGDIIYHGLSGMDFVLGADADLNTLEIVKMIEDEQGNLIAMRPGTQLDHEFGVYQRVKVQQTGEWQLLDTKTAEVSDHGIGFTSDYGVPDGSYVIREETDSIPDTIIDANGDAWIYTRTYFETEGANRRDWPNEHDRWGADPNLYESEAGAVGANNRDLQFTCHNIYIKKTSVEVEKKWFRDGEEIEAPENAEVIITLGRYQKTEQGGGEDPIDPVNPDNPDPEDPPVPQVKANIDIYQSNYGHRTLLSENKSFYAGQTLRITLNKQKQAPVSYTINGVTTALPMESGNGTRQDYSFEVVVPADGILNIPLDDAWGDVQNIRVQAVSGSNMRRNARTVVHTENLTWTQEGQPPEGYQVDRSFVQPVQLSNAAGWSRSIRNLESRDAKGNEYLYYIAKIEEKNVPEGTTLQVQQPLTTNGDEPLVVHNVVPRPKMEISFTKLWYGADTNPGAEWPEDIEHITVTLKRYYENAGQKMFDPSFTQTVEARVSGGEGYTIVRDPSSKGYVIAISDLEQYTIENGTKHNWIYTITEDPLSGYHIKYLAGGQTEAAGAEYALDGGTVENHLDVYQLPHTGGPGTWKYKMSGVMLILFALCLLWWRQKQERRSLFDTGMIDDQ